ncbi:uncharacterized protein pre-mod(mdg4)-X [Chelonus insularis]|uniref:uncharacterized protein pre-mod(mdg4)-X n=1 Tax=Chelonus insularis TaxID=460826 RepID=UPI00158890F0|nr:uncharacterized protein LOC118071151 [Chelonus insularis]
MTLKFVTSQKGKKLLLFEGHLYSLKSYNNGSVTWRCVSHNSRMPCSEILHTNSDEVEGKVVRSVPKHEHAADAAEVKAKILRAKLKCHAGNSDSAPLSVIAKTIQAAKSPVVGKNFIVAAYNPSCSTGE